MRSYEVARKLFSFLEFVAWGIVALGSILFLVGVSQLDDSRQINGLMGYAVMVIGILAIFMGLLGVAAVQVARATVDTAELTQQMLKVSRDHLGVSRHGQRVDFLPSSVADKSSTARIQNDSQDAFKPQPAYQPTRVTDRTEPSLEPKAREGHTIIFKSKQICREGGKYVMEGISFDTLEAAKNYVASFHESEQTPSLTASKTDV